MATLRTARTASGGGRARRPPLAAAARRWDALRRPLLPLALAGLLTALSGFGVTRLQADASANLLADTGSSAWGGQVRFADVFGADPVVVMVEPGEDQQLLTPEHMVGMAQLEGDLARLHGVRKVYGPGTLINTFANELTKQALDLCSTRGKQAEDKAVADAKAAGKAPADQTAAGQQAFNDAVRACAQQLAARYPSLGVPALNNPGFYQELLLEPDGSARPFWKAVLPDPTHALISVRMNPDASVADVEAVVRRAESATGGPATRAVPTSTGQQVSVPTTAGLLAGTTTTVSGTPVVAAELAAAVRRSLALLLPLTLLAMLVITALVLRVRHRLLAVQLALLAGLWTAGLGALAGLPLTPATLAVLPVVLGLSTDYLLQTVNRLAEESGPPEERVRRAAAAVLPATGLAALATAAGVLAFAVSTVPLVRQFAFFMAGGVAMSFLAAVLVGLPVLGLWTRWRPGPTSPLAGEELEGGKPGERPPPPSWERLARAGRLPRTVVLPLAALGLLGWAALPMTRLETDPVRLLPPGSHALQQAEHIRSAVGLVGEVDLVVTGPDVTSPAVVTWMAGAEDRIARSDLTPVSGLPQFLTIFNYGQPPDAATTKLILKTLPPDLTRAVVSSDGHLARIVFGQGRLTSVEQDRALVARFGRAGQPPAGYEVYPAGLSVVAASALDRLTADQVRLTLLAIGLVLAVLLAAYRRPLPALLAVMPTVAGAGWVTAAMFLAHASETPITILLSGVVIAFATEFGVLWLARYRAERAADVDPVAAADAASRRVGPAIVASAAALVAGFAALAVSPVPMVRDFGLWCAADLALATAAVLVLLPPAARAWLR